MGVSERYAWSVLRRLRKKVVFRRQYPLGPYVLDFYCPAACLAVELDSAFHNPGRDFERDDYLARHGMRVLRLGTESLFENGSRWLDIVLDAVEQELGFRPGYPVY